MISTQKLWGRELVAAGALARLLTPAAFGLVAMVSSVLPFVALIQDLGLTQATMQRPHMSDPDE
jgi:PST family polysaccharide transporter